MLSNEQSPYWLPRFFAVGPPRTGTTWLHAVLVGHVNLPRFHKETRFFDANYDKGLDWYAGNFDPALASLPAAEICPTYFYSLPAQARVAELIPDARIICSLRDPVERVYSLYKIKRAHGSAAPSFEAALKSDPELTESGRYCFHLGRWRSIFGAERVLALVYEDLERDAQSYLNSICDFVELEHLSLTPSQLERVNSSANLTSPKNPGLTRFGADAAEWLKTRGWGRWVAAAKSSAPGRLLMGGGETFASPDTETIERLRRSFRSEVEQLEEILQRDLSIWSKG